MTQPCAASSPIWLGVDLGTHAVRAQLVSDDGVALSTAAVPLHSTVFADGRHEQDPEQWWHATREAIGRAVIDGGRPPVRALAVCSTSGTVALVEATNEDAARPLSAGLMYDDVRAVEETRYLDGCPQAPGWERTGFRPTVTSGLAKALWLTRRYSARLQPSGKRAVRVAHQADVITSRLAGRALATDTSHAMKTGADLFTCQWPQALLDAGIDARLLPDLVPPGTVIGEVSPAVAADLGLPNGVSIVAGMTDGCANQIAANAVRPGRWCVVLGTTFVYKGVVTEPLPVDGSGALYHHRSPDGYWWPGGAASAGIGVIADRYTRACVEQLDRAIDLSVPGPAITYPLRGMGERFPFVAPDATSFTLGTVSTVAEAYRALVQGAVLTIRLSLEHLAERSPDVMVDIVLSGGGANNPHWAQLISDILGKPVSIAASTEGATGMAILAASANPNSSELDSNAHRMLAGSRTIRPRRAVAARFEEYHQSLRTEWNRRGWTSAAAKRTKDPGR
jgi:D-ribulokinase